MHKTYDMKHLSARISRCIWLLDTSFKISRDFWGKMGRFSRHLL